jgi:hypothetical protein
MTENEKSNFFIGTCEGNLDFPKGGGQILSTTSNNWLNYPISVNEPSIGRLRTGDERDAILDEI